MNDCASISFDRQIVRRGAQAPRRFGVFTCKAACASALVFSLGIAGALPYTAFADVRQSDEILSRSIAESGLGIEECPDIQAENALLIGQDGTVYFARDSHEAVKIASITKVMTAIVALENAPLDTEVVVDSEAAEVGESSAGLIEGDSMSLETALYALMVPSGNDASIAIAKAVGPLLPGYDGGDPQAAFVNAMNAKAAELGCADTFYTNPHGLDADEFESESRSTASDVGIVVSYAMKNEVFRTVVDAGDTTISVKTAQGGSRDLDLISTDELIGVYDGICGVKTGTTIEAGYCFAGAASRDEGEFYSVVLNSPDSPTRFADTVELLDWTYGNIDTRRLINAYAWTDYLGAQAPLVARVAHTQWVDCSIEATAADPELSAEVFALAGPVEQEVSYHVIEGDVKAGDVVGSISFVQAGKTIAQTDLVATRDQAAPNIFQKIGVAFDRFVRSIQSQPSMAESACLNSPDAVSDL